MSEKLTQEQLNEWSYPLKSELEENEEKKKQAQQSFNQSNEHLNEDTKQAINTLDKKEKLDEQIKAKQSELDEFKSPKAKREFIKEKLDGVENDDNLRESLKILKKKERIEELIKEKEQEIQKDSQKTADNDRYKIVFLNDTGGDNYGVVEETKLVGTKEEIIKYYLDNKEQESTSLNAYGNSYTKEYLIYKIDGDKETDITHSVKDDIEKGVYDHLEKEKGEEKDKFKEPNEQQSQQGKDGNLDQDDWNKRADELELQHEKELEKLKDEQSRLEANFQKSIDNLMNSDGINGIITALQEMDRSLEMMMRQGKDESEAKDRQRKEKLEFAFDSPNFREAVGDLVKEVYAQRKEAQNGLMEMENEHANYAKLKTTYEKEVKNGLDVKGYEKLSKMMGDIEKDTPNFKKSYPKFYQKISKTLDEAKNKILNKNQYKGREI
ncbi:hypothetical protein [Campylobacter fetus]|uniref:hypothetical protein n=1 Tax=Campylobacter fetus TaxID=196 RepID=UPI001F4315D1|nr:hypothetical protein [Campylobacter fetus]